MATDGSGRLRQDRLLIALLVVVTVVVAAAVVMLGRTQRLATGIDDKTESIAEGGGGIALSTKAIIKLDTTTGLGESILASAEPLEGKLAEAVRVAQSIDATASSIRATAGAVNGTAKGINGEAASILAIARSINRGVEQINENVDVTIGLIAQIKADTGNILGQAQLAHKEAACIDQGLPGGSSDGHCS